MQVSFRCVFRYFLVSSAAAPADLAETSLLQGFTPLRIDRAACFILGDRSSHVFLSSQEISSGYFPDGFSDRAVFNLTAWHDRVTVRVVQLQEWWCGAAASQSPAVSDLHMAPFSEFCSGSSNRCGMEASPMRAEFVIPLISMCIVAM